MPAINIDEFNQAKEKATELFPGAVNRLVKIDKKLIKAKYSYLISFDANGNIDAMYQMAVKHKTKPGYSSNRLLGSGAEGEVRKGYREDGTPVAIKHYYVNKYGNSSKGNYLKEFNIVRKLAGQEANVLLKLGRAPSNNFAIYKKSGTPNNNDQDEKLLTIQDYIKGDMLPLYEKYFFPELSEQRQLQFCIDLYEELKRFHENGFTHNDLHRNNILVEYIEDDPYDPKPRIIDAGMSSVLLDSNHYATYSDCEKLSVNLPETIVDPWLPKYSNNKTSKTAYVDEIIAEYEKRLDDLKKPSPS